MKAATVNIPPNEEIKQFIHYIITLNLVAAFVWMHWDQETQTLCFLKPLSAFCSWLSHLDFQFEGVSKEIQTTCVFFCFCE
ncbi:hypothetical protein AAC387_Pa05g3318 [Persea americana]